MLKPSILRTVLWSTARLAQSAERKALHLVVVGSSHMVGVSASSSHGKEPLHCSVCNVFGI